MQILDSHVHFVDTSREEGVVWPPADSLLLRSWTPTDFEQANSMHASARCVAVETSRRAADDDWLLRLADSDDRIAGVVLNLQPDETGCEERLRTALASEKFVGIRLRPIEHYDFADTVLQQNLALLGNASKTIEFGAKTDALKDQFVHLAQQFDGSTWILDHCGHPPLDCLPDKTWLDTMQGIATCPNTLAKVTALPQDPAHAGSVLEALLEMFGPERLLYGSNWPVCTLDKPAYSVVDLGTEVFGRDAAAFLSKNARRCYGLTSAAATSSRMTN